MDTKDRVQYIEKMVNDYILSDEANFLKRCRRFYLVATNPSVSWKDFQIMSEAFIIFFHMNSQEVIDLWVTGDFFEKVRIMDTQMKIKEKGFLIDTLEKFDKILSTKYKETNDWVYEYSRNMMLWVLSGDPTYLSKCSFAPFIPKRKKKGLAEEHMVAYG